MNLRVYVATSWRNLYQPSIVTALRKEDFEVYDFRHPEPGDEGFHWSEIDEEWRTWSPQRYIQAIEHPLAVKGFAHDENGLITSDAGVLVLPCNRSSHLEAGYFYGAKKPLIIYIPPDLGIRPEGQDASSAFTPELMYKVTKHITTDLKTVITILRGYRDHMKPEKKA
jgi:hypothetical protein